MREEMELARKKGVFISVSFHARMSNYSCGDWRQANLHRAHICLSFECNIEEHGWLVKKKAEAVGEQNNNEVMGRRRRWRRM